MKNDEIIEKRFTQIDAKLKTLELILDRPSTKQDFKNEIQNIKEIVEDLESHVNRITTPLRNG
jgi:archaellum component FlaC